jgi:hypothetical protein
MTFGQGLPPLEPVKTDQQTTTERKKSDAQNNLDQNSDNER